MRRVFLFVIVLFSFGCASKSPQAPRVSISDAVRLSREGKNEEARRALAIGCISRLAAACHALGQNIPPLPSPLGIVQGPTNDKATTIAVLYTKPTLLSVLLWDPTEGKVLQPVVEKDFIREQSAWAVRQARYENLSPEKVYMLQVLDGETLLDAREVTTLDLAKPKLRFAPVSCMDDKFLKEGQPMWEDLVSLRPDLILFMGDNVYADRVGDEAKAADAGQLWERYSTVRSQLAIFKQYRLIPIIATWDDHDYGQNDGDRTYKGAVEAKNTFFSFFPQSIAEGILESGPGIASSFVAGGQKFILMDDRTFRSAPQEGNIQTHWGKEQEDWLYATLGKEPRPTWIVEGDQFFGKYHEFESYEGRHPQSFEAFLTKMRQVKTPFALISGDRHHAELMEIKPKDIGRKTYEITSSGIHAQTFANAWKKSKNPRFLAGQSGIFNYTVIESTVDRKLLKFKVTAFGPGKKVLYEKDLVVK